MKVSAHSESDSSSAAASAAGRERLTTAFQRKSLVGLATNLINPVLGLFRQPRRLRDADPAPAAPPTAINKLKLESFSSRPVTPAGRRRSGAEPIGPRWEDNERMIGGSPLFRPPGRRRTVGVAKGGCHHV